MHDLRGMKVFSYPPLSSSLMVCLLIDEDPRLFFCHNLMIPFAHLAAKYMHTDEKFSLEKIQITNKRKKVIKRVI